MTKRKLKPLWQVFKESKGFELLDGGIIAIEDQDGFVSEVGFSELSLFGKETSELDFPDNWYEDELPPVPEKRRKLYAYRVGASAIRFHTKEHSEHGRAPEYDLEF